MYYRGIFSIALLSRQFVEMNRLRVEGLLASFPKLIGSENTSKTSDSSTNPNASPSGNTLSSTSTTTSSKQHTFVETENVRYVYLPIETLYLLLITNKNSNIIEDLDTLRLLSRVIPEQIGMGTLVNEESVVQRAFELLFAIDEVVAAGGYREDVTLHQIRTNLEMESHEEKLAQMIKASKMAEAKEAAKRRAQEIRERSREDERLGRTNSRMTGFGGGGNSPSSGYDRYGSGNYSSGGGGNNDNDSNNNTVSSSSASSDNTSSAPAPKRSTTGGTSGGMKLGGKKAGGLGSALANVIAEEGIKDRDLALALGGTDENTGGALGAVEAARAAAEAASADQATVYLEEGVSARISRDGGCQAYQVKGSLTVLAHDDMATRMKVLLKHGDDRAFLFSPHPNLNKAALGGPNTNGAVSLKDPNRSFPVGTKAKPLTWRYTAKDDDASQLPLMLTCWPEEGAGGVYTINVEYTLQRQDIVLNEVIVSIPLGTSEEIPKVGQCDGVYKHNTRENLLAWRIENISADNSSGELQFTLKGKNIGVDSFFPVNITFSSTDPLSSLNITDIVTEDDNKPLRHSIVKKVTVEEYVIE